MKKLHKKDKNNRYKLNLNELTNFILKVVSKNTRIFKFTRWNLLIKTNSIIFYNSKRFLINCCILTNRKKFFNKSFRISRLIFLKIVRFGFISGISKASW